VKLGDGDLKTFLTESATMDAEARGELLLKADGIANIHKELALTGQSEAPEANVPVNFHFVAFVHRDGGLYELGKFYFAKNVRIFLLCILSSDGRRSFPINHGETTPENLLEVGQWDKIE